MIVLQHLINEVRSAAAFNSAVQAEPACILWPDPDRQWSGIIPVLQAQMSELLVLGEYNTEKRSGPAIWLRCVIAGTVDGIELLNDTKPIVYLPGVSRQELRDVRNCPAELKPIVELQYRGSVWTQLNSKDWTILAFLKSSQGGLGLDVAQDSETKISMQLALRHLLDEEITLLKGKQLGKDYFNTLLTGGDPVRDLLSWLDQGDAFREGRDEITWKAFVSVCKSNYAFDPQKEGILSGAAKLAGREGLWRAIWDRYSESPKRYPTIPLQIRKCVPPVFDLFADAESAGGWPQWNEQQEHLLAGELKSLNNVPEHQARAKILELEKQHSSRRSLVWAELSEAPLANALQHLANLVSATENRLAAGSINDLAVGYQTTGWKADAALIGALASLEKAVDLEPVSVAINAIYRPWAENAARYLQKVVTSSSYPGANTAVRSQNAYQDGDCVVFVDGLRFDAAKLLVSLLTNIGCDVVENPAWAALPSVTATGKPAVSPVRDKIQGGTDSIDFEPCVADSGQSLKGGYHLKKLLNEAGWSILNDVNNSGRAKGWSEVGDIDHEGHGRGWKLARHLDTILNEICDQIDSLLDGGWKNVRVVTDHGWLLLPGGLPKIELSSALVQSKWGRCAAIKSGASTQERLFEWYWNPSQHFALADGISCFKSGEEYSHGGLSLQECLTLELVVTRRVSPATSENAKITNIIWRGLRCSVTVKGADAGSFFDIRREAGDPSTSVVYDLKPISGEDTSSVVVEDEELEGKEGVIVIIDSEGSLVAQAPTTIGGDKE